MPTDQNECPGGNLFPLANRVEYASPLIPTCPTGDKQVMCKRMMREDQFSLRSLLVLSTASAAAFGFWPWTWMGIKYQLVLFPWCVSLGVHISLLILMWHDSIGRRDTPPSSWLTTTFHALVFSAVFSSIMLMYLLPRPLPDYGANFTVARFVLGIFWLASFLVILASFFFRIERCSFSRFSSIRIIALSNLLFPLFLPDCT